MRKKTALIAFLVVILIAIVGTATYLAKHGAKQNGDYLIKGREEHNENLVFPQQEEPQKLKEEQRKFKEEQLSNLLSSFVVTKQKKYVVKLAELQEPTNDFEQDTKFWTKFLSEVGEDYTRAIILARFDVFDTNTNTTVLEMSSWLVVGPFPSKTEAEIARKNLLSKGWDKASVKELPNSEVEMVFEKNNGVRAALLTPLVSYMTDKEIEEVENKMKSEGKNIFYYDFPGYYDPELDSYYYGYQRLYVYY
jgi:flagellar basal body-associated protein FliL